MTLLRVIPRSASAAPVADPPCFVDWLSISQEHAEELPVVDAGAVWAADAAGVVQWRTHRALPHEGSFDTHVNVRCDGHRVTFSGNVSRFGRPDNVFGFGLVECLARINAILAGYRLPPFSPGVRFQRVRPDGDADYRWTGARISRIDLTANYAAGSADAAHAFLAWLGSQHAGRHEGRRLGQGETVCWGGGKGARSYWKAYLKGPELAHRGHVGELVDWCRDVGLVRFEGTLRTKALLDAGAAWLGDWLEGEAMGRVVQLFEARAEVLGRAVRPIDDVADLPRHLRGTARDYLAGVDCAATMSRASFYRHRAALLPYGIDIAVRNVAPFVPRVQVIKLERAAAPAWYWERAA